MRAHPCAAPPPAPVSTPLIPTRTRNHRRRDGVTVEQEARLRCAACQLVVAGGAMLNLPHDATLSAASFVLRFYAERSWVQFADPMPIVSACIFLASKLEEVRRGCVHCQLFAGMRSDGTV